MGDPRDDAIIKAFDERVDRLVREFGGRHDLHRRDTAQIQKRIADLADHFTAIENHFATIEDRIDSIERRIGAVEDRIEGLGHLGIEIQRGSTHTQMIAQHVWNEFMGGTSTPQPPRPMPEAPRPAAVDEACAVPPGESPRVVRLPRYGATLVPEPGYDPAAVWPAFIESVNSPEGGSSRGIRGSRRTRRH